MAHNDMANEKEPERHEAFAAAPGSALTGVESELRKLAWAFGRAPLGQPEERLLNLAADIVVRSGHMEAVLRAASDLRDAAAREVPLPRTREEARELFWGFAPAVDAVIAAVWAFDSESPNAQDQVARTPGGATGTRNPEGLPASPGSALAWQEGITPAFGWWWHRFYALQRPTRAYVHTDGRGETWAEIEGKCGLMRCGFEGGQGQWAGPYESPAARDAAFSPNGSSCATASGY